MMSLNSKSNIAKINSIQVRSLVEGDYYFTYLFTLKQWCSIFAPRHKNLLPEHIRCKKDTLFDGFWKKNINFGLRNFMNSSFLAAVENIFRAHSAFRLLCSQISTFVLQHKILNKAKIIQI